MKKTPSQSIWIGLILIGLVLLTGCAQDQMLLPELEKGLVDRIAFFSTRDGSEQIYLMAVDGKGVSKISFNLPAGVKIGSLTWSNVAQKWAFSGVSKDTADIYVASGDGKIVQNITNSPTFYEDEPVISPDGKRIAYIVSEGGKNTALTYSFIDGSDVKRANKMPLIENSPAWTKDSKNLLLLSSKEGTPNIFKVGIDGGAFTNLSKGQGLDTDPTLAENNSMVAFISDRAGGRNIFGYDFKKNEVIQLNTSPIGLCSSPKLSSDGSKVVFRSDKDGGTELYVLTIKTQLLTRLTNTPKAIKWTYDWSPDGQNIFYTADNNGQLDIFLTDVEGKQTINLTDNPANDNNPLWVRIRP
jgi:TolB protein